MLGHCSVRQSSGGYPVRPENPKLSIYLTFSADVLTLAPCASTPSIAHRDEVSDDPTCALCIIRLHGGTVPGTRLASPGTPGAAASDHGLSAVGASTSLRATDRLCWAWLSRLWSGWRHALAFVQPRTVIAWQQQRFRDHWRRLSQPGKPGRPAVAKEVRALIQAMWLANPAWGSPRIMGELHKLGIDVAKSTVETYRVRPHRSPSPT